jgi:hypothetical protein
MVHIPAVKGGLNPKKTTKSVGIFPHYALYTLLHNSFFGGWGGGGLSKLLFLFMFSVLIVVHNFERSTERHSQNKQLTKKVHCRNKIALKQKQQETVNTGIKLVGFLEAVEDAFFCYFSSKVRKNKTEILFTMLLRVFSSLKESFHNVCKPFFIYYPRPPVLLLKGH